MPPKEQWSGDEAISVAHATPVLLNGFLCAQWR